ACSFRVVLRRSQICDLLPAQPDELPAILNRTLGRRPRITFAGPERITLADLAPITLAGPAPITHPGL
ncbi:MAG: hypothetical protein R3B89_35455, partial [Polyangiaceae bacterium]